MTSLQNGAGFVVEEFAAKTLAQRVAALRDVAVLLTQLGANTLNILFAETPPCAILYLVIGIAPSPQIDQVAAHFWPGQPRILSRNVWMECGNSSVPCLTGNEHTNGSSVFDTSADVDLASLQAAIDESTSACLAPGRL